MSFTIPNELLRKIDSDRGDIPRSRFLLRLLEKALKSDNNSEDSAKMIPRVESIEPNNQKVSIVKGEN